MFVGGYDVMASAPLQPYSRAYLCLEDSGACVCKEGADGADCTGRTTVGDGLVQDLEECDDRNTESGDGCSANGTIELGFLCGGWPTPAPANAAMASLQAMRLARTATTKLAMGVRPIAKLSRVGNVRAVHKASATACLAMVF